ncbi:hypothetical protein [Floccifex sp.]|uniref:hypothetical protein n=1 Tax=Floccifex sp. TaxID=2815810 RepID=UPI003F0DAE76
MFFTIFSYLQFFIQDSMIQIQVDDIVDIEQSTFIYEDEILDSLSFTLQEGNTTLYVCLKDEQGNILEENEQDFFQDTTPPIFHLMKEDYQIKDKLVLWNDMELHLDIEDESEVETKIYVDDILQKENDFWVKMENQLIRIECVDEYGNQTIEEIPVEAQKDFISSNINEEYTLQNHVLLSYEDENFVIEQYFNDEKINEIEHECILNQPGNYRFLCKHKLYPYLEKEITSFTFTNQQPWIEINNEQSHSMDDILVQIQYNCPYLLTGYIKVQDQIYDLQNSFLLSTPQNETFQVEVFVQDVFGQIAQIQRQFYIDKRKLECSLYFNEKEVESSIVYFTHCYDFQFQTNKEAHIEQEIKILNENIQNIMDALYQLPDYGICSVSYKVFDDFGQEQVFDYQFIKLPVQVQVNTPSLYPDRTYTIQKEKVEIKKEVKDIDPPDILFLFNKQKKERPSFLETIRMSLSNEEDFFVSLIMNGKEIDLSQIQKDEYNHNYYEFKAMKPFYSIQVIAKDNAGNINEKDIEIHTQYPVAFILFLIPLIYIIKKVHEKNSNHS